MWKFKALCFPRRSNCKVKHHHLESGGSMEIPQRSNSCNAVDNEVMFGGSMEIPQRSNSCNAVDNEPGIGYMGSTSNDLVENVILSHDFAQGLHSWRPNCCEVLIVPPELENTGVAENYALVTNRKQSWQGLEQDITSRVSPGTTYTVFACVGVSGHHGPSNVQATVKLEYKGSSTEYLFIQRISVSKMKWETLEGTFKLSTMPDRVVFYLEGPQPDVDLLIKSVSISCSDLTNLNGNIADKRTDLPGNIILNHNFSQGLHLWQPNSCDASVVSSESTNLDSGYARVTNRKECWQGLEQDITSLVSPGCTYKISAKVRVSGIHESSHVKATLRLVYKGSKINYLAIERISVSNEKWETLEGNFVLASIPDHVVFYLEGPNPGIDILVKSVTISCSSPTNVSRFGDDGDDENIILNPAFEDGLNNWSGRGCKVVLHDSMADGSIKPQSGKLFAAATERTQFWNGIQQDITTRVKRKLAYEVTAVVRIFGNKVTSAGVRATLWVQSPDKREQYIGISNVQATVKDWAQIQGKFLINGCPSSVVIYLEGPPPGTDILLNSLVVKHAPKTPPSLPPSIQNASFGINIVQNSELSDGTNGWFPLGNCTLSVVNGSPHILPPMAADSLGPHQPLSGRYILVTKRTQNWMGPAQMITDKVELFLTYQVSAWVKVGSSASGPQNVNIALSVDGQWVNGGQVEIRHDTWHEIGGSFRIEKQPSKIMVYVQGPAPGVDLMLGSLQIFAVDRQARFKHLRRQTDKIRKRDVVLKVTGDNIFGSFVKVRQTQNSFSFGSCINRTNIDNEDFVAFFLENFNWAVFGNELKWYWTEAQKGNFNYKDADEMLELCEKNNIQARGHCIFWEVEDTVQSWVKSLSKNELMTAVQNRLTGLLTRYKGKFRHYDVNNEMLHGSFYQDRLGKDIRANMFKIANKLDLSALLFVNDYHIEDGNDPRSSPEKYIEQVLNLQEQGAPVGGVGIQGHIDSPVGSIVYSALEKLGILGLPLWFTELDVSSINEYVRADDLEVMLREAYAHPAVEGIMLWGFWELFMSRENSHLVNAEGEINEAGMRYLKLKHEWLTRAHGHIDEQEQFCFRGFHGTYEVEILSFDKAVTKTFVVDKGDSPLILTIDL